MRIEGCTALVISAKRMLRKSFVNALVETVRPVGAGKIGPGAEEGLRMRILIIATALAAPTVAAAQGQADMGIKAEAARRAADSRMNVVYRRAQVAMKALDAQDTSRGGGFGFAATLLDAQRKWIALRDRQCPIEQAVFQGGSMAPMVGAQCATRMTDERTHDLQALLTDNK